MQRIHLNRLMLTLSGVLIACLACGQDSQTSGRSILQAQPEPVIRREALVIGNTHYAVGGLQMPETDAKEMDSCLKRLGFKTKLLLDANRKDILTAVKEYGARIKGPGALGFVYYAGHGVQYQGHNYLIPIGAEITGPDDLDSEAYDVNRLFGTLREAGNASNVVVLDACRTNPFSFGRDLDRGLAPIEGAKGTLIAFSTAPGEIASDSGLYRRCLVEMMLKPGLMVEQVFKGARSMVDQGTKGGQIPWENSSFEENYYLVPGSAPDPESSTTGGILPATMASWYEKGLSFFRGTSGFPKDLSQARKWFEKAADAGHTDAQCMLGYMYANGLGDLAINQVKAVELFQKSADAGDSTGMASLGIMYEYGGGGLVKDEAKAVELYKKSADAGDSAGMANLGIMYEYGRGGLVKDEAKAVELYKKSADAGDSTGMNNLGVMYENGRGGLVKDDAKAVELYKKCADAGYSTGMVNLGFMYENGRGGLVKDDAKAVELYKKSADAGNSTGMAYLGAMYEDGRGGLAKDETKAVQLYQKAADDYDSFGTFNLGRAYENGIGGLSKDQAKAIELYKKAAELGSGDAKDALKRLGIS